MGDEEARDFLDTLQDSAASVRHRSYVYRFSRLRWYEARQTYGISIEKYRWTKEPFADFIGLAYQYESPDADEVLRRLEEDVLWDGKGFHQWEKALTRIDW